jgi:hypothetical protein
MFAPFVGPVTGPEDEEAELPEVVAIDDLTTGAIDAAAAEIAADDEEEES